MNVRRMMLAVTAGVLWLASGSAWADPIKVLIIDGQNNHNWKATTPVLKDILEKTGRFKVDVATSPPNGGDMSKFQPKFSAYDVVVSNYNGQMWSKQTQQDLINFVKGGGGLVVVHAADNAFPQWPEWNLMIGLGGWGGRNEKSGPYVRFKEGKFVEQTKAGPGGGHGQQHEFVVTVRNKEHPITRGLPDQWMHAKDELYDKLRGPAQHLTVLATAYSDPKTGGTGEHEPSLMVVEYGKGRVFHTTMGHADYSMKCVAFGVTLARGTEWAATGKVTQEKIPADFPTATKSSSRK